PIYGLGTIGHLTAVWLGVSTVALVVGVCAIASRGIGLPALAFEVRALTRGQARLPVDAFRILWRARSPFLPVYVFAALLIAYLAVAAYLGPAFPRWDSYWYHEPMIGYAIQNH